MKFLKKIKYHLLHPRQFAISFLKKFGGQIQDELYLKIIFYLSVGYKLDLNNPKTYNEKLQWLKLNDTKAIENSFLVDKYLVKKYIAKEIGEEYVIPTLGVWNRAEDIDFNSLPQKFVLKCTHDSGGIVICHDKANLDIDATIKKLNANLSSSFYKFSREYVYKDLKPKIIAEKYMEDNIDKELKDYKFLCFNGNPEVMIFMEGRQKGKEFLTATFYDMNYVKLPFIQGDLNSIVPQNKPSGFEKMKELSKQLSRDFLFVRVDFYNVNGKIYFGEMTFYPTAGFVAVSPIEWDYKLGEMLKLPKVK